MSLPPRTRMTLNISCCTGLKKLTEKNWEHNLQEKREENEYKLDEARRKLHEKMTQITGTDVEEFVDGSTGTKELRRLQDEVTKALAVVKSLPEDGEEITPNPFVVVAIDDDDVDRHPMLYTKALRSTTNPIWKEEFEDFPLEMYLTGKAGMEMFENGDKNYRPQYLSFFVYHDDGVPDKGKAKVDDDDWKRDEPQRGLCIAKATWEWTDLCRSVGCAEFEKDFQIYNPNTHKKIGKDAKLTIKVQLCAPKIMHCNCMVKDMQKRLDDRFQEELELEQLELEEEAQTRKITRSRSRKGGKTSKAPRRRLRKKI